MARWWFGDYMESNETDSDLLITVHLLLVVDYRKYFA